MSGAIGFIGLGIMGDGMARILIKSGRKLVVWNRTAAKAEALKAESPDSVVVAATPAEALAQVELAYVMLSTPDVVKAVYEMEGGVLAGVAAGKKIVDCATLAVEDMTRLNEQVTSKGGRFLEAPVSGSKGPAANGQLIFLCGGDEALYTECAADLDAMGKAKFFFGEVGAGTKIKLCVNMTMGSLMCAFGEGFSLCTSSGMDASKLLEVLGLGVCGCPLLSLKGAKMLAGDHAPNFPLQHAEKDMRLAIGLAAKGGLALPLASVGQANMKRAMDEDKLGDQDFSSVFETQKKQKL